MWWHTALGFGADALPAHPNRRGRSGSAGTPNEYIQGPWSHSLWRPAFARGSALCRRAAVRLIIIDMNLPDGTGIDFITWLQSLTVAQGRNTPGLAISGHPNLGVTAAAAGFRATVPKPLEIRALVDLAEHVLSESAPPS